jgi:hypothetical protein
VHMYMNTWSPMAVPGVPEDPNVKHLWAMQAEHTTQSMWPIYISGNGGMSHSRSLVVVNSRLATRTQHSGSMSQVIHAALYMQSKLHIRYVCRNSEV